MTSPFSKALLKKSFGLERANSVNTVLRNLLRSITTSLRHAAPIKEVVNENDSVKVKFADGVEHSYPSLFLQDNCTCPNCFHHSSQSRLHLMTDLDLNKQIVDVQLKSGENSIRCTWSDGHEGIFSEKWLLDRIFTTDGVQQRTSVLRDNVELVGANYVMERQSFEKVLQEPSKLLRLLRTLCKNGVSLLEGAPKQVGELRRLVDKIGFIRTTHYGNEFTVKSIRNSSNLAYTSATLCIHTDLPYYVYPPGVQILHCIQQYQGDDGGHSNLVDGFLVAEQMKIEFPEQYQILGDTPVEFADIGEDFTKFNKIHHSPTFVYSKQLGLLERIVYSNQQLSSFLPVPIEKARPLYGALKLFTTLCYDKKNMMRFKLKEGDVLVFDNWRFLHGREGFDASKGDRHLEGCYVDWDEVYSTIRVLTAKNT